MAMHLADANDAVLKRRDFATPPRPANYVLKVLSLYAPLPWPRNYASGADPASKQLIPEAFEADRSRAITTLRELAAGSGEALVSRHPVFGLMTPSAWRRWAFLHVDHHLRQFGL